MTCSKLDTWLQQGGSLSESDLPDSLSSHLQECAECRDALAAAREYRRSFLEVSLPKSTEDAIWQKIERSLPEPAPQVSKGASWFAQLAASLRLSSLQLASFGVAALILVALITMPMLRRSPQAGDSGGVVPQLALGTITGNHGFLRRDLSETPLGTTGTPFQPKDLLVLQRAEARANVRFNDGSTIQLEGTCRMTLADKRLAVKQGAFLGQFSPMKPQLNISVPGAELTIVGTTVRFQVDGNNAVLDLIEGQVDVDPADKSRPPFAWRAPTRLVVTDGRLQGLPQAIPAAPAPTPTPAAATLSRPLHHDTTPADASSTQPADLTNLNNLLKNRPR